MYYEGVLEWWEWAVFDENGLCGVREDSPENVKKAYEKFKKVEEDLLKKNIRL